MKLQDLKQQLEENNRKSRVVRKEFQREKKNSISRMKKVSQQVANPLDHLKIIGITGSRGKSTTAYIVHEYLKKRGYKSVLYSSICVDSPASYIKKEEAYEVAVGSKEALLSIIKETEAYGAEYLVLEINESTIAKGIVKDVPFDVRVLTNLNPRHNLETYIEEEYVNIKKSFFENIQDDCKIVLGLGEYDKELWDELLCLNENEKLTFSSRYVAMVKGVKPTSITCLLNELDSTTNGLKMGVQIDQKQYQLETKLMMSYNAFNILCAMTILKALDILNVAEFEGCIADIKIPGRAEVYNVNGRMIVIDTHLPKMLECLQEFKDKGIIQKIKVVVGSIGHGYKTWDDRFNHGKHFETRHKSRKYAMELLKQYVDYVYLTENDNAAESVLDICTELQNNLGGIIPSTIIEDREKAIRQAILDSTEGDAIFISGRGNRRILCDTALTMKLVKDSEVVEKVLEELGW